jgi:cellulose synthase/poly-beta-1,6-N-acetylglucosamine synthase-like glycosyltransferase
LAAPLWEGIEVSMMMQTSQHNRAGIESGKSNVSNPRVSVIIPAYKVAPFIREAIDSVLAQTFGDHEIIVINDGSPDTVELEKELETYAGSIIYIEQSNQGAGAARNAGIRAARGEFIALLDGDDVWLPEFLSSQIKLIESDGGYDLVYADAANLTGSSLSRLTNMDFNRSAGPVTAESLISARCNVVTSSVVARRQMIVDAGLFDEAFPNSQDFDLWLRLAKQGARINYQKKVLVHRRIYQGSLASDPIKSLGGEIKVLEKTEQRSDLTSEERAAIVRTLELRRATVEVFRGKQRLSAGEFDSALEAFRVANGHLQSWKLRLVMFWLRIAPRLLQKVYRLRAT